MVAFFAIFTSVNLSAQVNEIKQIIPPSPIMTPYIRYGDYPVSYNTGMANMSVPLYTIKVKDFTFPIDISFHASGRRTALDLSTMGVGWVLNATGFISREIRGRPDELGHHPGTEVTVSEISHTNGQYDDLKMYKTLLRSDVSIQRNAEPETNWYLDSEHDLYNYNVNGMSGKFVLNDLGNAVPLTSVPYHFISDRIIIDEKGVRYEFGNTGNEKESTNITHQNADYLAMTGMYLSKIILPSGEQITFTYGSRYTGVTTDDVWPRYEENYRLDYSHTFYDNNHNFYMPGGSKLASYFATPWPVETNIGNAGRNYTIHYLTSINFGSGKVVFNYNTNNLQLTDMEVLDAAGLQIKRADFTYMQTPGTSVSLYNNNSISLASLDIDGGRYAFDYYNYTLPSTSNPISDFYNNKDWWGYSNVGGNKIPIDENSTQSEDYAAQGKGCTNCKIPSYSNKVSGMLRKITYPTKGSSEFFYESNLYQNWGADVIREGPGLRIGQIINEDGRGNKVTRQFKYGPLLNGVETGTGTLLYTPKVSDFKNMLLHAVIEYNGNGQSQPSYAGWHRIYTWQKVPWENIAEAYQLPVYYSTVTEYIRSSNGVSNGKTVYDYSIPESFIGSADPTRPGNFTIKDWTVGRLYNKWVYKYRPVQNDYQVVRSDQTVYTDRLNYVKIPQVRFRRDWTTDADFLVDGDYWEQILTGFTVNTIGRLGSPFSAIDWPVESAAQLPAKQISTEYVDGVAALTTETDLFYDNPIHLQPTRKETFTSKADEKHITQTSYVQDFSSPGTGTAIQQGISNFQNRYIIAPLEISEFKAPLSGTPPLLIGSQRFTYNPVKAVVDSILSIDLTRPVTNFVPLSITTGSSGGVMTKDNRYSKKISFDSYDSLDNLLQQHLENGVNRSYIWGYNKQYPIAEAVNAAVTDIWYEGFEESSVATTAQARTGHKSIRDSYTKSLTGLSTGKYTLSYWKETNGVWSLVLLNNIDVTGGYTINITNTGYCIDDVRFYPKDSQMTTLTYDPLIGITSSTDAKNQTSYYSYDYNKRLQYIKDQYGNIVKGFTYHYKP